MQLNKIDCLFCAVVIVGDRHVGKTTLITSFLDVPSQDACYHDHYGAAEATVYEGGISLCGRSIKVSLVDDSKCLHRLCCVMN